MDRIWTRLLWRAVIWNKSRNDTSNIQWVSIRFDLFRQKEEFTMKKCSEVMTKNPACCLPTDAVSIAAQLMKKENVGSIIDSEQTKKLVGIVTDRDLALKVVADGRDSKSTKVVDVMTHKIITCHLDDDIQKAVGAMAEHQLRRMPVVDNDLKIVGIISQADVATRVDQPEGTAEMVKEISRPTA
jgi:CBS domain-containing protein